MVVEGVVVVGDPELPDDPKMLEFDGVVPEPKPLVPVDGTPPRSAAFAFNCSILGS